MGRHTMPCLGRWDCRSGRVAAALILAIGMLFGTIANAVEAADPATTDAGYDQAVLRGIEYLRTHGQAEDGSYSAAAGPAVTALVTTALLRHGRTVDDPLVARSLDYVSRFVHEDGGIYAPESSHQNYETCLAILCFSEANRDGRYDKLLANADKFIRDLQWDGGEGHDVASPNFGGAGYGSHKRPDLSNTQFLVEALKAGGAGPDDEALQNALIFVSRCQNLESEYNTTPFAAKNPDKGFYYTPAAGGSSQAGETPEGGLRSYASMTYAGLKSMIYAGVDQDDPRVQAALEWIRAHYDLDSNAGMGDAGLYYYYNTFAKALDAVGSDTLEDASGQKHDWRRDLIAAIVSRQHDDGSWTNSNSRWLEGDPNLVTGYALLALAYCHDGGK